MQTCLFCGQKVTMVHVHGHYQCPVCKTNAMPCCDGDNCDTNLLLHSDTVKENQVAASPGVISQLAQARIPPSRY